MQLQIIPTMLQRVYRQRAVQRSTALGIAQSKRMVDFFSYRECGRNVPHQQPILSIEIASAFMLKAC